MKKLFQKSLLQVKDVQLSNSTILEVDFYTQSLFPIYCIKLINLEKEKFSIIAKVMENVIMAQAEANALLLLHARKVNCPKVYGLAKIEGKVILFLSFIQKSSQPCNSSILEQELVKLYSNISDKGYGFSSNNYIGSLPLINSWCRRFRDYWWYSRLLPFIESSIEKKFLEKNDISKIEKIVNQFIDHWGMDKIPARLIHGDLWSGNVLYGSDARVYLIDPSVSYSNPEQDLAMLDLFGSPLSFSSKEMIAKHYGVGEGYQQRVFFWQLYPLLVHINLFGESYLSPFYNALKKIS